MKANDNIGNAIRKESIFIIGSVSSVEGRKVKVRVKKDKNLSHLSFNGKLVKNVSVGSYIKIAKGFVEIIGKVEGEQITKEKVSNEEYGKEELKIARFLEVSLFGHFENGRFRQGIKEMPLIDNECYLLTKDEFNNLHRFHALADPTIEIGTLTEEPSQEIRISIAKLFASHIGIFGNTGSGKSNTLAKLYTELFRVKTENEIFRRNAKFILIDFNGEYTKHELIDTNKKIYNLSTRTDDSDKYSITRANIERLDMISILLEATEKTQKPFLNRALSNDYLDIDFKSRAVENIKRLLNEISQKSDINLNVGIFAELFLHLKSLESTGGNIAKMILDRIGEGHIKYHGQNKTYFTPSAYAHDNLQLFIQSAFDGIDDYSIDTSNFSKLKFKIISRYFHEIVNGYSNQEHIRPLIGRMFKKLDMLERLIKIHDQNSDEGDASPREPISNLEIVSLKDVNLEMKKTLPLIIVKQLYDEHKERGDFKKQSLHIIIDEAHNILSSFSERESETWKDYRLETFEELIKEGRKFSTFLTISSQRPYDISSTIISQLHNYFIHRLINENDIKAVEKTIAYLDKLSFESIPVLSVGSCFVAGLASDIPVKVDIDLLPSDQQPKSETIDFNKAWLKVEAEKEEEEVDGDGDNEKMKEGQELDAIDDDLPF